MSKYCQSCGNAIADEAKFCIACGAKQTEQQAQSGYSAPPPPNAGASAAANESFTAEDIEKNKAVSGLAYFIFFLPLVAAPDSAFGRFHANQALLLLIVSVGIGIVLSILPLLWVVGWLLYVGVFAFTIMGLVNGLNGKAKELPLFGKYRIIK